MLAVADTHALIWYLVDAPQLSETARAWFERAAVEEKQIGCSSISLVEILYLEEKGRIQRGIFSRSCEIFEQTDNLLRLLPLDLKVVQVLPEVLRTEIPDLPDRIIAATARRWGVPLLTRDGLIQRSNIETIW